MKNYTCQDISFKANEAVLAGTLCLPAGHEQKAAIILVSGSGTNDRDETVCGHKPFLVMADYFASRGYVVLRYDDQGVGASTGNADAQDFDGSVSDVLAAYQFLAQHESVDSGTIVLIGHSEGGLVSAEASTRISCRAIVTLAAPATPIVELLHYQAEWLSKTAGATPAQIAHERKMNEEVFKTIKSFPKDSEGPVRATILRYLESWPGIDAASSSDRERDASIMAAILCSPAYCSLLQQSPAATFSKVRCPVLAVYGSSDRQVPGNENAAALQNAVKNNPNARVEILQNFNHLFQKTVNGSIEEYESLPAAPDIAVLDVIHSWLQSRDAVS